LLREHPLDVMLVVGGYNSSNTCNLARICAETLPTYHIADPACLAAPDTIRHRPVGSKNELTTRDWLPSGSVSIGLTAGASTPDNLVGQVVQTLDRFCQGP
jgi:4-hydroxy-3-methylbut-2-enyl diphosphate reductase